MQASDHSDLESESARPNSQGSNVEDVANEAWSGLRVLACILGISLMVLLQTINISALTTMQSAVAKDLDAFELTSWFTSAYLIPSAALSPLSGKLAAILSPRVILGAAATSLTLGSAVASAAPDFSTFVVGRILSGIGSAGVITSSTIVVLEITKVEQRGLGIGLLNSGFTIGVSIGGVLGGALAGPLGWRAVFWLQCPLIVLAACLLVVALPPTFGPKHKNESGAGTRARLAQLDYGGAVTLTATITLVLLALSSPSSIPIIPLLLAPVMAVVFVLNEVYLTSDPIIPIALLRSRGLLLTCLATTGYMMGRWTVLFYAPTYAIAVRSWPPALAGSVLIPTNFGFAAGGLLAGYFHIRRKGSFYLPTLICYIVFPVTLIMLAFSARHDTSAGIIIMIVVVCGLATGAALNYSLAHLLHLIPPETSYVATALLATFRGFAGSFGSAIGGGLFARTLKQSLQRHFAEHGLKRNTLIRQLLGSPILVSTLEGVDHDVAVQGYEDALKVLWLAAAGLAGLALIAQAGTGWSDFAKNVVDEDALVAERQPLLAAAEDA